MNTIKKHFKFNFGNTKSENSVAKAISVVKLTVNLCRLAIGAMALVWLSSSDILKFTVAIVALGLTMLPKYAIGDDLVRRITEVVLAVLLAAHILFGMQAGLYETSLLYDKFIHTLGSSAVAGVLLVAIQRYFSRHQFKPTPALISVLVVAGTLSAGTLWEFFEYAIDTTGLFRAQRSLHDTMLDLIADALGALITVSALLLVIWVNDKMVATNRISALFLKTRSLTESKI